MAWACAYSCHQCFALVASVNSVNNNNIQMQITSYWCLPAHAYLRTERLLSELRSSYPTAMAAGTGGCGRCVGWYGGLFTHKAENYLSGSPRKSRQSLSTALLYLLLAQRHSWSNCRNENPTDIRHLFMFMRRIFTKAEVEKKFVLISEKDRDKYKHKYCYLQNRIWISLSNILLALCQYKLYELTNYIVR